MPTYPRAGGGDMYKSTYDTDNDSVVDNAKKLNGKSPGLADGNICELPTGTEGQVLKRGASAWEAGSGGAGGDSFLIVATSNTPTTLKNRADYVGDQVSDQSEINTAFGVANAVILAPGTFIIDGPITIGTNQSLFGSVGSIIKIKDSKDASMNMIQNSDPTGGNSNILIHGISLDGNRSNQTTGTMHGVYLDNASNCKITNCTIKSLRRDGVKIVNAGYNKIMGCHFEDNGYGPSIYSDFNEIVHNTIKRSLWVGIFLDGACNNLISGNIVLESSQYINLDTQQITVDGPSDDPGDDNIIANNIVRKGSLTNKPDYAIKILTSYCNRNVIHGNDLYLGGDTGDISDSGTNTRKRDNIGNSGAWLTDV